MSDYKLTDVVLAVDGLIGEFGTELFAKGISEGEADQRRRDEEAQQYDERRAEHLLKVAKSKRLRKVYSEKGRLLSPPHEGWVFDAALVDVDDDVVSEVNGKPKAESKVERLKRAERLFKCKAKELSGNLSEELEERLANGLDKQLARNLATNIGERWIHCWSPAELADDKRPRGSGLVPIPGTATHGERCLLLATVHRKFAVGANSTLDPDKVSFLYANGQGRGYGHYAILVEMVDGLTADAKLRIPKVLMAMVEDVRKEFTERTGGQEATAEPTPATVTGPPIELLEQLSPQLAKLMKFLWSKRCASREAIDKELYGTSAVQAGAVTMAISRFKNKLLKMQPTIVRTTEFKQITLVTVGGNVTLVAEKKTITKRNQR